MRFVCVLSAIKLFLIQVRQARHGQTPTTADMPLRPLANQALNRKPHLARGASHDKKRQSRPHSLDNFREGGLALNHNKVITHDYSTKTANRTHLAQADA